MRLNKIQKTAVTALQDIKARDITVLDVRKLTSLCDTLIIATAESTRQVKALAQHVREALKAAGASIIGVEGEQTGSGCSSMPATSSCTSCSLRRARTTISRSCGRRLMPGGARRLRLPGIDS
jgi:ribosome silencing factor RsfS/YbeB/iojap